ncbi:PAS domain S-box protein [Nanoarchaeota archaeon]
MMGASDDPKILDSSEELRSGKVCVKGIINSMSDALWIIDPNGKTLDVNAAAVKMYGYRSKEELMSKTPVDVTPKKDLEKVSSLIKEVFSKGYSAGECSIVGKDGTEIPVSIRCSLIKNCEGNVTGGFAVIRDITEQKVVEIALRDSEQRYQDLYDNAPDLFVSVDAKTASIINCNQTCAAKLGYTKEEIIGRSIFDLYTPESARYAKKNVFPRFVKTGKVDNAELQLQRKDGSRVDVALSVSAVRDAQGNIIHSRSVWRDISEKKKIESEQERLHKEAKERLELIENQNVQLLELQRKLKQYSKRLEIKVKRLEQNKLQLTDKEKLVFYAMTAYPELNDRGIAEKVRLRRSTVTAVKNRLRKEGMYSVVNIPNLRALGCGLLTFLYGDFGVPYEEMSKHRDRFMFPGIVCVHSTDSGFYSLLASKDVVEFHKNVDPIVNTAVQNKLLKAHPASVHLPFELCTAHSLFNFAPFLNHLFGLGRKAPRRSARMTLPEKPLSRNMKGVLYALVRYPEESTTQLAGRLGLTRATVASAKSQLVGAGLVHKTIIPNLKKLDCDLLALCHTRYAPGTTQETRRMESDAIRNKCPHIVFDVGGDSHGVALRVFRDYSEQTEFQDMYVRLFRENGYLLEDPAVLRVLLHKTKTFMLDFSELTRKMLDIPADI